jgi:hypothetical protein
MKKIWNLTVVASVSVSSLHRRNHDSALSLGRAEPKSSALGRLGVYELLGIERLRIRFPILAFQWNLRCELSL